MINKVSVTLDPACKAEISQITGRIGSLLPFLITLSDEERKGGMRMGINSLAFIEKALRYAEENPQFASDYVNLSEFRRDYELASDLFAILQSLQAIVVKIEDTAMQAATEALPQAIGFYATLGRAKADGVPGAAEIHDDLSLAFPGRITPVAGAGGSQ